LSDHRLNPDAILEIINFESRNQSKGKLRVFLGMSAGVGKTYAMLKAAHQRKKEGYKVLIGIVETHQRADTAALIGDLEILPRKKIIYKDKEIEELDLDLVLKLKPDFVVIDELAHTNAFGSRHTKRHQDVSEILDAGINVYTALNVQHLESRKDIVEQITGIVIRETVPDSILEQANLVELVDIAPSELLKRLSEGKIYLGDKALVAANNFFTEDKLTALREIALRMTAERVDQDLQKFTLVRSQNPWQTNQRILVAISHSPHSEKLIRAARRLAYNLEAPWIALYVDTGIFLNDEDQNQLQKNLNLSRELNAEVVNISDADLVSAIGYIVKQKNVTQIIIGRPSKRWIKDFIEGGSFLDRLFKSIQEVDIHIVNQSSTQDGKDRLKDELALYKTQSGFIKYYYVLGFYFFVTMIGVLFEPYIGYRAVGFIFLLAVVFTSLWGSISAVFFSALLSALIWNFGFIPPKFTFIISNADDMILCIANFVVAITTGLLTNRIRIREKLIREREEKTNLLNLILQDISSSQNKSEFIQKVCSRVSQLFLSEISVVLKSRTGQLQFDKMSAFENLNEKEQAVALWTYQNHKMAGWSTETLSQAKNLFIPLIGVSEIVGVFVFKPNSKMKKLSIDQKELLLSVTTQLSISIERHFFSRRLQETQRLKDSELLHQTLLNSISHEMKTPLSTIVGITTLLEKRLSHDNEVKNLTQDLMTASERLNRVIENLLDMSRINSGLIGLKVEWHDLTDLIGVVLKKIDRLMVNRKISIDIADDLPLIKIDFSLFEHAITNLIVNSIQYSGSDSEIQIKAYSNQNRIFICIQDNGVGIPLEYQEKLFEKFYRVPGSPTGGTGLGLSIVKGIVELHKGKVTYENNIPKGSRFLITLPKYLQPDSKDMQNE